MTPVCRFPAFWGFHFDSSRWQRGWGRSWQPHYVGNGLGGRCGRLQVRHGLSCCLGDSYMHGRRLKYGTICSIGVYDFLKLCLPCTNGLMTILKLFSESIYHATYNFSNEPLFLTSGTRSPHPLAWWIMLRLCVGPFHHFILILNLRKNMPANPLSQNGNWTLSMIKKNSQVLPHTKPKPSFTPSTQPDISTTSSFLLETSTTPSSRTTLQDVPAVDLLALKEELKAEIKKSLFEEFNTMLHQELASF